jgi:hypothetical protein
MKAIKTDGYISLTNDNGKPLYCIHRNAVSAMVPDKFNQPVAIESLTRGSMCGDHCPFFEIDNVDAGGHIITISCATNEVTFGVSKISDDDKPKSNLSL